MERIRVLYCIETLWSGGVERRRLTLAQLLNKERYEIKIICTVSGGLVAEKIRQEGVEIIEIGQLKNIWDWKKYKAVLNVVKSFNPHIIHGAVFEGVLMATVAGSIGRVPIVVAEETSDPTGRTQKATFLLKALSLVADKFVGVSTAAYNYLKIKAKIHSGKLHLITNGVMTPSYVENNLVHKLKQDLGVTPDDIIIGSVGRLINGVKLFTDLIDALALLKSSYPKVKLLIIGGGQDLEYIKDFANQKGVGDRVIMAGHQHDPHPFYQIMDIFALVSSTESFGLAAVEAMFHKLPVIASRVGGLKDIVVHEETGLLVEAHQPAQIAGAIEMILLNPELRLSMGDRGYKRALNNYSAERYVKDVEQMYEELLKQKQLI